MAKRVLVVGDTGKGKSTICNCLVNKGDSAAPKHFEESNGSVSCTLDPQEDSNDTFTVIDTIGYHDNRISRAEVLQKIASVVQRNPEGFDSILFVFDGRFTDADVAAYDYIVKLMFPGSEDYVTLVRNRARAFDDPRFIAEDVRALKETNHVSAAIVEDVTETHRGQLVYVNTNEDSPQRYQASYAVLRDAIERTRGRYRPRPYDELVRAIGQKTGPEAGDEVDKIARERESSGFVKFISAVAGVAVAFASVASACSIM
jgi:predicted GTPase